MIERQEIFDKYINSFKDLSIENKNREIISSLKELLAIFDVMAAEQGINIEYLKSREILDINNNGNNSIDNYLEAIFVYLEISKDILGQYFVNEKK